MRTLKKIACIFAVFLLPTVGISQGTTTIRYKKAILDTIKFNNPSALPEVGRMWWNEEDGTLNMGLKGGNVTLHLGQEMTVLVVNKDNQDLVDGDVVYISGVQGQRKAVKLADARTLETSATTFGVVTEPISKNQEGYVTFTGLVRDLNTSHLSDDSDSSRVWLDTIPGKLTHRKPPSPARTVEVGYCLKKNPATGMIWVAVQNALNGGGEEFTGGVITKIPAVGQAIASTSTADWINKAFYAFVPATIALASSGLYEVGTVNTRPLTTTIIANSETVFSGGYIDLTSVTPAQTVKTWVAGGNQSVQVTFTPIQGNDDSLTKTFRAYQTVDNDGSPATIMSGTVMLSSVYPYKYGMSVNDTTNIYNLSGHDVKAKVTNDLVPLNSPELAYIYYAYPVLYGELTAIYDQNNYPVLDDFNTYVTDVNSSGLPNNWSGVSYRVYRSKTKSFTPGTITYRFVQ